MSSNDSPTATKSPKTGIETTAVAHLDGGDSSPPVLPTDTQEYDEEHHRKRHPGRFFGLPQYQSAGKRNFDYDSKYPNEDPPGEEISDNSPVWMIYNDEVEVLDDDMLHGFHDTLDSLLVFAALFSAVMTTLLVQTSTKLEPDHAQITTYLLAEQIQLLRANGNLTAINAVSPSLFGPNAVTSSPYEVAINVLFFVSLALSLSTALFSILVKQWLTAYAAKVPGTPKNVALTRHFRFVGLQKWKLPEIIGVLPLILHSSLWVFAAGLLLLVWQQHQTVFCAAATVLETTFGFYSFSLLVPPFVEDCPYYIPFLDAPIRFIGQNVWSTAYFLVRKVQRLVFQAVQSRRQPDQQSTLLPAGPVCPLYYRYASATQPVRFLFRIPYARGPFERVLSHRDSNLSAAVVWLFQNSSNPTIRQAAARSLAGLLSLEVDPEHYLNEDDEKMANVLAPAEQFFDVLFDQLKQTSLPTSFSELQSMINPSSRTYNPWVRAESALHSWSYYWMQQDMLREPPDSITNRSHLIWSHCCSSKKITLEFITYFLNHEHVWDPRRKTWSTHSLDWNQWSLFTGIAVTGMPELVELFSSRADINVLVPVSDAKSMTPVGLAAFFGNLDVLKAMAAAGADLGRGQSPLRNACRSGRTEVIKFLLTQPDLVENAIKDVEDAHLLFRDPISTGETEIIRLLLGKGIRVSPNRCGELNSLAKNADKRRQEIMDILGEVWCPQSHNLDDHRKEPVANSRNSET
ncbi:hypothetical protein DL96DRAFT_1620631 [Flagelloscypha sp. PMI_526]|nr:hypothetical protein DL96DRAFT_1620631 [Flagelloscypha sp. PMI_526]